MKEPDIKILDERTYRKNLMGHARELGCEKELILIFNKFDNIMKNCSNLQEKQAMAAMGALEVHRLLDNGYLGIGGKIEVNGSIIAADKTSTLKEEDTEKENDRK